MTTPAIYPDTVVQAIDIECPVSKVFEFMHDAQQWLPWAVPDIESMLPLPFGQWLIKTPHGLTKLRSLPDPVHGILDYELVAPASSSWRVPVRLSPTATGCHLAIKFSKPPYLPLPAFETSMQHIAEGLHTLKLVLEQD